jgi:hypothetical protein
MKPMLSAALALKGARSFPQRLSPADRFQPRAIPIRVCQPAVRASARCRRPYASSLHSLYACCAVRLLTYVDLMRVLGRPECRG